MVARFVNGKNIRGMLYYNENKVTSGDATILLANGFAGEITGFSLEQKLKRFEQLTMLNTHVKTNAIHISLNFDPQDKLAIAQLQQIAAAYMERIGFGDQPYLVYRHIDAGHTHIHIATVNIRPDGSRIDTHGIGWKLSEPARIAIEKEYGLVEAKGKKLSDQLSIKAADIEKAIYGKTLTKRAISNIVNAVVRDYHFTSLAELNAILRRFNVTASRGGEQTLMYEKGGLLYSLINEKGEQVGVPIKASSIYNQPTLKNLQKAFEKGKEKRLPFKEPLRRKIDQVFKNYKNVSKATFIRELQQLRIDVIFRANQQGFIYGVSFIDHNSKAVFNGSDLGKDYAAKALLEKFSATDQQAIPEQAKSTTTRKAPIDKRPEQVYQTVLQPHQLKIALAKYQAQMAPTITKKKKKRKGPEQDQGLNL